MSLSPMSRTRISVFTFWPNQDQLSQQLLYELQIMQDTMYIKSGYFLKVQVLYLYINPNVQTVIFINTFIEFIYCLDSSSGMFTFVCNNGNVPRRNVIVKDGKKRNTDACFLQEQYSVD